MFSIITFKGDKNLQFFHRGWCISLKSDHICEFKESSFSLMSDQAPLKQDQSQMEFVL